LLTNRSTQNIQTQKKIIERVKLLS